jgi:hypothetical protein
MKKLKFFFTLLACSPIAIMGQIKVESNGNIGVGNTTLPLSSKFVYGSTQGLSDSEIYYYTSANTGFTLRHANATGTKYAMHIIGSNCAGGRSIGLFSQAAHNQQQGCQGRGVGVRGLAGGAVSKVYFASASIFLF